MFLCRSRIGFYMPLSFHSVSQTVPSSLSLSLQCLIISFRHPTLSDFSCRSLKTDPVLSNIQHFLGSIKSPPVLLLKHSFHSDVMNNIVYVLFNKCGCSEIFGSQEPQRRAVLLSCRGLSHLSTSSRPPVTNLSEFFQCKRWSNWIVLLLCFAVHCDVEQSNNFFLFVFFHFFLLVIL